MVMFRLATGSLPEPSAEQLVSTARTALGLAQTLVEFLENLDPEDFTVFWAPCALICSSPWRALSLSGSGTDAGHPQIAPSSSRRQLPPDPHRIDRLDPRPGNAHRRRRLLHPPRRYADVQPSRCAMGRRVAGAGPHRDFAALARRRAPGAGPAPPALWPAEPRQQRCFPFTSAVQRLSKLADTSVPSRTARSAACPTRSDRRSAFPSQRSLRPHAF